MNKKICKICKKEKHISNFHKNGVYYRNYCKKCNNKIKSKRDKKDVDDLKDYYVRKKIRHIFGRKYKPNKEIIEIYKLNIQLKREIWKNT